MHRRTDRIQALFGGYQARATTVDEALRRTGYAFKVHVVTTNVNEKLAARYLTPHQSYLRPVKRQQQNENEFLHWTPEKLHRLVAHFLRVRFPMLLALNKVHGCLWRGGNDNIERFPSYSPS
jgi:ribosome-binding ATPase YchF (GTP1/OBG family)